MGTSGAKICVIDDTADIVFEKQVPAVAVQETGTGQLEQNPQDWWRQVVELISSMPEVVRGHVQAIATDGTSGTILLCDGNGHPTSPALMYNDNRATQQAEKIGQFAPAETGAQGASSSLAKLLWILENNFTGTHALHQADWIAGKFCGRWDFTDENNILKLGYDPVTRTWPEWLDRLALPRNLLPQVFSPGSVFGKIDQQVAQQLNLPDNVKIVAGTTDSIAGFLATGANKPGDAVTSLGSTLVIKLINDRPVYSPKHGVYSHRLGDQWLVGGASNSGGAVLRKYFDQNEMDQLTPQLQPEHPTGLYFYPLPNTGERFPYNDPTMKSDVEPVADRLKFFQGLLESIAEIEKLGYEKLSELGCTYPEKIFTTGGGSKNSGWQKIRSTILDRPVLTPKQTEAAYGTALLAKKGYHEQ